MGAPPLRWLCLLLIAAAAEEHCPQCEAAGPGDRRQAARLRLEAIRRQILSKLHLRGPPNITAPLPRELALEALRRSGAAAEDEHGAPAGETHVGHHEDDYYARTSEIIAFAEPGRSLNGHVLLDFFPSQDHVHLRVTAATLWIQLRYAAALPKKMRHPPRERHLTLYAFRVAGGDTGDLELLASYRGGAAQAGWRRLEVGEAVRRWFADGGKLTLLVDCVGCDSRLEMALFEDDASSSNTTAAPGLRPFLAVATEPVERRRSRRHSTACDSRVTRCCRQSLYVSFRELGWDEWIIAPKGYFANFCMGDCTGLRRTPDTFATFHTHVIEEYRSRNPYASIRPCCAPTRLSPMSLIYFDPDLNIIKTDLPKMIVEECGCT